MMKKITIEINTQEDDEKIIKAVDSWVNDNFNNFEGYTVKVEDI